MANRIIEIVRRGKAGKDGHVGLVIVFAKATNFTAILAERGTVYRCSAVLTVSFDPVSVLTNGWHCIVVASENNDVTLDPNAAELIDGEATVTVAGGTAVLVYTDGSALFSEAYGGTELLLDLTPQLGGALDVNNFAVKEEQGADVVAASDLLVLEDGNYFDVTGTGTITEIAGASGNFNIGSEITLHFETTPLLTHHPTQLILPDGANMRMFAGATAGFRKIAAGDWRMVTFTYGLATATDRGLALLGTLAEGTTGTDTSKVTSIDVVDAMVVERKALGKVIAFARVPGAGTSFTFEEGFTSVSSPANDYEFTMTVAAASANYVVVGNICAGSAWLTMDLNTAPTTTVFRVRQFNDVGTQISDREFQIAVIEVE